MLIRSVEKFLSDQRMSPTAFGRNAVNDPAFVSHLRAGRETRPAMEARVRAFMNGYAIGRASAEQ